MGTNSNVHPASCFRIARMQRALSLNDLMSMRGCFTQEIVAICNAVSPTARLFRVQGFLFQLFLSCAIQVVVFSGSQKEKMEEVFGDLEVWLAAENGIFLRPPHAKVGSALYALKLASSCCLHGKLMGRQSKLNHPQHNLA